MSVTGWDGVTLTVELGLSADTSVYGLWDVGLWDQALWGPEVLFSDVTTYVRDFATDRQFSRGVQQWREGTATITLDNRDGRFSPANLSGPYVVGGVTQIRPLLPVRITASYASVSYPVYYGYVQSWTDSWTGGGPGKGDSITTLECVDEWADLTAADGIEVPAEGAGDTFGARIHRILDAAAASSARNIDVGSNTMQATTLADNTVAELEKTVEAEGGALWIEADGTITADGRNGLVENDRSVTSQATFTDDGTELSYATAEAAYNGDNVINYAAYTREGSSSAQIADAPTSRSLYRDRRDVRSGLICQSDGQALALAQWAVIQYQDPEYRFVSVEIKPRRDPAVLWPHVLGRQVRDMVTVVRNPPGGYEISRLCHIAGITHQVTRDNWVTTFHLWSATLYAAFATSRWDVGEWDEALWSF